MDFFVGLGGLEVTESGLKNSLRRLAFGSPGVSRENMEK
jgi:hypothetical protein